VRGIRRTVWQRDRNTVCQGPARSDGLHRGRPRADHRNGRYVRAGPAADPADPEQRRVQGPKLLLRDGGQDFRSGYPIDVQTYFDEKIDIHHVFPQAWCKANGIDAKRCDSVVNKTPLSAKTNRIIGGNAPSTYLARLQRNAGIALERMDEILKSHVIAPTALRADDFNGFFAARVEALLARIEGAMLKPIARDSTDIDSQEAPDYEPEEVDA
jgi:hypothetical protein